MMTIRIMVQGTCQYVATIRGRGDEVIPFSLREDGTRGPEDTSFYGGSK